MEKRHSGLEPMAVEAIDAGLAEAGFDMSLRPDGVTEMLRLAYLAGYTQALQRQAAVMRHTRKRV